MDCFEKRILLDDVNELVKLYDVLDPKSYDIIYYRYGFGKAIMTLDEIGKRYNLSKERIRQLEKEAKGNLKWHLGRNNSKLKLFRIFEIISKDIGLPYIAIDVLCEYIDDIVNSFKIACLFDLVNSNIKYSNVYRIVYDNNKFSLDDINQRILNVLKYAYTIDEYNELPLVAQTIVKKNYIFDGNIYRKKKFDREKEVADIIRKLFPYGFRPSNKMQIEKLNTELLKEGIRSDNYNVRELFALLDRENFCLIDRGTYIYEDDAIELPQNLLNDISKNILNSKEKKVYYNDLYEQYKDILEEYGINNYFYLKGIIDNRIDINYPKRKDYIIKDDSYKQQNIIKSKVEVKNSYWDNYVNNMKESMKKYIDEVEKDSEIVQEQAPNFDDYKLDYVSKCALDRFIKFAFKKNKSNTMKIEALYKIFKDDYKALQEEMPFVDSPEKLKKLICNNSELCEFYISLVKLKL